MPSSLSNLSPTFPDVARNSPYLGGERERDRVKQDVRIVVGHEYRALSVLVILGMCVSGDILVSSTHCGRNYHMCEVIGPCILHVPHRFATYSSTRVTTTDNESLQKRIAPNTPHSKDVRLPRLPRVHHLLPITDEIGDRSGLLP